MIKITNKNGFDFNDRYDGQDYRIPAGKTVAIGEDAASHFFGLGAADKIPYLVRQGWMNNSGQLDEALQKLNNFAFDLVDDLVPGEIVEAEQGSAPLQPASAAEDPPDGGDQTVDATPPVSGRAKKSILDQLGGA